MQIVFNDGNSQVGFSRDLGLITAPNYATVCDFKRRIEENEEKILSLFLGISMFFVFESGAQTIYSILGSGSNPLIRQFRNNSLFQNNNG